MAPNNEHRDYTWGESYTMQFLSLRYEISDNRDVLRERLERAKKVIAKAMLVTRCPWAEVARERATE